jgi:hypothetical protein
MLTSIMRLKDPSSLREEPWVRRVWHALGISEGYITGGFLRDHMLGRSTFDLDLSLPGTAAEVSSAAERLAVRLHTRAHLIGTPPRSVWRIDTTGSTIEIWPMGQLSLERDVRRRDYTINALMWRLPAGPLIDLVGGVDDMGRGRIRAISRVNLERDPVRLLRGPRFVAVLRDFFIEHETAGWIRELAPGLAEAPRERVGSELLRLSTGARAADGLAAAVDLDLLVPASPAGVLPDLGWLRAHLEAADRLATASQHPLPSALREAGDAARLGLLLVVWRTPPLRDVSGYGWNRCSLRAGARAAALLEKALRFHDGRPADRRELIHASGISFPAVVALAAAIRPGNRAAWRRWWRQWRSNGDRLVHPTPLIPAQELVEITGIEAGPELGEVLAELRAAHVRREIQTPRGALRWLKERGIIGN